jgi:hypothetical protein
MNKIDFDYGFSIFFRICSNLVEAELPAMEAHIKMAPSEKKV